MNITKNGNSGGAASSQNIEIASADNSVIITKTEEGKTVNYDLKVEPSKPVEVISTDPKIQVQKNTDAPDATYFLLSAPEVYDKDEVEARIDKRLVGVYRVCGSLEIENIKTLQSMKIGDVYNCSDGGELCGQEILPGDNVVYIGKGVDGNHRWDNLHGSISVVNPSVELKSTNQSINIVKTEGADNTVTFDLSCAGTPPEGDWIPKSGSYFYDTFSRNRREEPYNYNGTEYPATIGDSSICISPSVEHGSIASGAYSHVEGDENLVTGDRSNVAGNVNVVFSDRANVFGGMNTVTNASDYSFIAGYGHKVNYGWCTAVFGKANQVGTFQFVAGLDNIAIQNTYSNIIGSYNELEGSGQWVNILGSNNKNISGAPHAWIVGGYNENESIANGLEFGMYNKNNSILNFSSLIGSNNEQNTVSSTSMILGSENKSNSLYDGTIIVGKRCEGFQSGGEGIVLGSDARPTLIDRAPLCLAIGNADRSNPGNIIAADREGNIKLYGNVLFDVDGVQYSMKQVVAAMSSEKLEIRMTTEDYDKAQYKKIFDNFKSDHSKIWRVVITKNESGRYTEMFAEGWEAGKNSDGVLYYFLIYTKYDTYRLESDGTFFRTGV